MCQPGPSSAGGHETLTSRRFWKGVAVGVVGGVGIATLIGVVAYHSGEGTELSDHLRAALDNCHGALNSLSEGFQKVLLSQNATYAALQNETVIEDALRLENGALQGQLGELQHQRDMLSQTMESNDQALQWCEAGWHWANQTIANLTHAVGDCTQRLMGMSGTLNETREELLLVQGAHKTAQVALQRAKECVTALLPNIPNIYNARGDATKTYNLLLGLKDGLKACFS